METAGQTTTAPRLRKPILLRAVIAGAYGAVTIFWQQPDATVLVFSTAGYLLASGAAVYWLAARLRAAQDSGRFLATAAVLMAGTGIVVLLLPPAGVAIAAAGGLAAAGAAEFAAGLRHRAQPTSRDWQITGVVSAGAGIVLALLPLATPPAPHAVLGVLGGSAIIIAVVLALAGLSARPPEPEEGRSGPGPGGKAVN